MGSLQPQIAQNFNNVDNELKSFFSYVSQAVDVQQ